MPLIRGGIIGPQGGSSTGATQLALSDGIACFTSSFSGVTSTSFSHGLGTTDLVVEFKDASGTLLIPDSWSIVNNNVISAEFFGPSTGDVTIMGCIASGLTPIEGRVILLEGLSGIVDLDSPNGSIDISTSGQVINLNAIFTPASGALLEQKCADIDTLSGLIKKAVLTFTPASGTEFVLEHGLGSEDFVWNMWRTDSSPIENMVPANVAPSGINHAIINLEIGVSGKIVLTI